MALSTVDQQDRTLGARRAIVATFGDGTTVPTAATKIYVYVPYDFRVISATMVADASGSAVIDVWRDTYATIPNSSDKITASAPPTLSSAQTSQDTTLTGWTTAVTKGILGFELTSIATCKRIVLTLEVEV